MSELSRETPEIKAPQLEEAQPKPRQVTEHDKEKLAPQETDSPKQVNESREKERPEKDSEHPKLEANCDRTNTDRVGNGVPEAAEHGKLEAPEKNANNIDHTLPKTNDADPAKPLENKDQQLRNNDLAKEDNHKTLQPEKDEKGMIDNGKIAKQEGDIPAKEELSPYAREKLDHFPKDAPEEIRPAYERACAAEPKITKDMQDVTDETPGAHLEGLDYRLKDGDSFARKASSVADDKGISPEEAADNMHDINRYTQVSDGDHLVDNANNTLDALKDKGYHIDDVNSTWGDDEAYKGINCKLTSPEGQPCELQFHTPESLETKEPMHQLYEKQRELPEGSPEWNEYEDQMKKMSSKLTPPKDIENLKTNYD